MQIHSLSQQVVWLGSWSGCCIRAPTPPQTYGFIYSIVPGTGQQSLLSAPCHKRRCLFSLTNSPGFKQWAWLHSPFQRVHISSPTRCRSHIIGRSACFIPEPGGQWLRLCPCFAFHFFFWSTEIFISLWDWTYLFDFSLLYFVSCGLKHDLTMPSYQEIPWLPL